MTFAGLVDAFWTAAEEALLPADCPVCRRALAGRSPGGACLECWASVRPITHPVCKRCSLPLRPGIETTVACDDCLRYPPPFTRARSVTLYEGTAREILHAFKFEGEPFLARPMGRMMARAALAGGLLQPGGPDNGVLVPVPQRCWKRRCRGYNPASLLALEVGRELSVPVGRRLLVKVRKTRDQADLHSREDRIVNLHAAFQVSWVARRQLPGRRIFLVDDILTTGTTAAECTRSLLSAGASEVAVLTFARTPLLGPGRRV